MPMTRRALLAGIATAVAHPCHGTSRAEDPSRAERYRRYNAWVSGVTPDNGSGLTLYMSPSAAQKSLSTVASADLLLLHLHMGRLDLAQRIGDGLVTWHQRVRQASPPAVAGGLPSDFPLQGGEWKPGSYFYAGDNLLAISALLSLYSVTRQGRYAETALQTGQWLEKTLFDGKHLGVWSRNYGPAMQFMREDGAVNNAIHTGMDFLWLSALQRLEAVDAGRGWQQRLEEALSFYNGAQNSAGCWLDHFKPARYDRPGGQWWGYQGRDLVLGDNVLRSALAAHHFGLSEQTRKFKSWLNPHEGTWLWGYMDPMRCQPRFLPVDTVYFDVVCTGLLRAWYARTGEITEEAQCQSVLDHLQASNGGWFWGVEAQTRQALNREQATLVGCWALANLNEGVSG